MKNKQLFTGIISLVLVFGLIGCDLDSDPTDPGPEILSTWICTYQIDEDEVTETLVLFTDGTWSSTYSSEDGDETDTGTYLLEGNTITFTLVDDDEAKTATISGNTLTFDDDSSRVYQKQ
jgi:hypothetical protein